MGQEESQISISLPSFIFFIALGKGLGLFAEQIYTSVHHNRARASLKLNVKTYLQWWFIVIHLLSLMCLKLAPFEWKTDLSINIGITECFGLEETFQSHLVHHPCSEQRHINQDQVA